MHKGWFVRNFKVPNATVTLQNQSFERHGQTGPSSPSQPWSFPPSLQHLATQVDNAGVGVIERQQHSIACVHLLQGHWFFKVVLPSTERVTSPVHPPGLLQTSLQIPCIPKADLVRPIGSLLDFLIPFPWHKYTLCGCMQSHQTTPRD